MNHRASRTGIVFACGILTQNGVLAWPVDCRYVHAKAAASKIPIRGSALFHGLRGGGTYRLERGNVLCDGLGDPVLRRCSELLEIVEYLRTRIGAYRDAKHGRAISGRKWAGLITGSKGGVVCALA